MKVSDFLFLIMGIKHEDITQNSCSLCLKTANLALFWTSFKSLIDFCFVQGSINDEERKQLYGQK